MLCRAVFNQSIESYHIPIISARLAVSAVQVVCGDRREFRLLKACKMAANAASMSVLAESKDAGTVSLFQKAVKKDYEGHKKKVIFSNRMWYGPLNPALTLRSVATDSYRRMEQYRSQARVWIS